MPRAPPLDKHFVGVYNVSMKRVNYHLTDKQIELLKNKSQETGLSVAELIRRAIDKYVRNKGGSSNV